VRELQARGSAQTRLDRQRRGVEPLFGLQSQTKWVGTVAVGTRNIDRWQLVRQLPVPNRRWPQAAAISRFRRCTAPTPAPPIFAVLRIPWPTPNCYLMSSSATVSTEGRQIASQIMLRSRRRLSITATSTLLGISEDPIDRRDANIQTLGNVSALQAFSIQPQHPGCRGACRGFPPLYFPSALAFATRSF